MPAGPLRAEWLAFEGRENYGIWLLRTDRGDTDEARAAFGLAAARAIEKLGIVPIPIPQALEYDSRWNLYRQMEEEMALRQGKTIDLSDVVPFGLGQADRDAVDQCSRALARTAAARKYSFPDLREWHIYHPRRDEGLSQRSDSRCLRSLSRILHAASEGRDRVANNRSCRTIYYFYVRESIEDSGQLRRLPWSA